MFIMNFTIIAIMVYVLSYMFTFKNEFNGEEFISVILFFSLVGTITSIINLV